MYGIRELTLPPTVAEYFAGIGLTKMACPAGSQGDKFVQSLGMAISYVLDGAELTITMSYDAGDMVFGK